MRPLFADSERNCKTIVRHLRRDYIPASRYAFAMKLRIKELREERGLTVEALAKMAGMSKSYLSELQSGKKQINAARLEALARALECSPFDIIDDQSIEPDIMDHLRIVQGLPAADRQAVMRHAQGLSQKPSK